MRRDDNPPSFMLDDPPCEMCMKDAYHCSCPACKDCGVNGDPRCYIDHELKSVDLSTETRRRLREDHNYRDF